jgi:hypothetical protein
MAAQQVFESLSENQKAAIGQKCKEPNCSGTYVERSGKYGPWVCCDATMYAIDKHKVYRPRGIAVSGKAKQEETPQAPSVVTTQLAPTPAPIAAGSVEQLLLGAILPSINAQIEVKVTETLHKAQFEQEQERNGKINALYAELQQIKAQAPLRIEIVREQNQPPKVVEGAHYLLPRLIKLLGAGFNVYLWGPAGSGKSTACLQAGEALGLYHEIDTLDPTTTRSMIQGYIDAQGKPVYTAFSRCYTGEGSESAEGGLYIAEEIDNGPAHVQSLKNSSLANGHAPFAWGLRKRSPKFVYACNGNTPGRPTRAFPDRRPMSAAFADRLYFMYWPIDSAIECRAAGLTPTPPPERKEDTCSAETWASWVLKTRNYAAQHAPTLMVTPRATHAGIKALSIGETPSEIAEALVFRGADDEIKAKVLNACPLPSEGGL